MLNEMLNKKVVVKFLDGQEVIGLLVKFEKDRIYINTGKTCAEIHFISAIKLIRPYEVR
jgi:hypothetical protein